MPRPSWKNNPGDARNWTRPDNPGFHSALNPLSPTGRQAQQRRRDRRNRGAGTGSPSIAALMSQAAEMYTQERYGEAARLYESIASTGERLGEAFYGLGLCAMMLHDQGTAEAWFQRAVQVDDPNADAAYLLGQLAEQRRDLEAASYYYDGAARLGQEQAAERLASLRSSAGQGGPVQTGGQQAPQRIARPRSRGSYVGIVKGLQKSVAPWRGRPAAHTLWVFILEEQGEGPGGWVPTGARYGVEMRNHEIRGNLDEGNWVEIPRKAEKHGRLEPKKLRNLTLGGAEVESVRRIFVQ